MTEETRGEWESRNARKAHEQEQIAFAEMMATQEKAPWHTVARTVLQVVVALAVLLPIVIPIVVEELGPYLPESWQAWLAGAVAFIIAVTGAVSRVMAVPAVNDFLRKYLPIFKPGN